MPFGVGRRHDRVLDGPGGPQRVGVEGGGPGQPEADPPLPLRAEGVRDLELHEGGERLVEPDPVPPLHGDEVAEPHVGELVGDHVHDVLELALRGVLRVGEQQRLPEGDAAEVLHGPEREVGDGHEVHRVARVGDVEVVGQVGEGELGHVEAEGGEVELAGRAQQPERGAGDVDRLGDLERPDDERHQVGGHRHGLGEAHPALAVDHLVGRDGGVGHRVQVVVEVQGDGEAGLEVGLVPAREGPAGVGGLELRGGDDALVAVVVGEGRPVEPPELVVQLAPEPERHHRIARRQRRRERRGWPARWPRRGRRWRRGATVPDRDPRLVDLELDGVEHHLGGGLGHLHVDVDLARRTWRRSRSGVSVRS